MNHYQTKDSKLRKKNLAENLIFEQTVQWGTTNEVSSKKAKDVELVAQKLEAETLRDTIMYLSFSPCCCCCCRSPKEKHKVEDALRSKVQRSEMKR